MLGQRILIVDDDIDICKIVDKVLTSEGYDTIAIASPHMALDVINKNNIDLIILDIMMPDISGFELCEEMRRITTAPILFLTAKFDIEDKKSGMLAGGDDYLTKPFSFDELIIRVKALLKRYIVYRGKNDIDDILSKDIIEIRNLKVDTQREQVYLYEKLLKLRYIEYKILEYMAKNKGEIISAQNLYEEVWQETFLATSNNTIVAHIKNLRKKLEKDAKNPEYIVTVWGKGYKLV